MEIIDSGLHLINFFAPALGVGLLTATLAKLVWWGGLQITWPRLAAVSCVACALALILGLVLFGRDGKMATYGLMLLSCTVSVVWLGLRRVSH